MLQQAETEEREKGYGVYKKKRIEMKSDTYTLLKALADAEFQKAVGYIKAGREIIGNREFPSPHSSDYKKWIRYYFHLLDDLIKIIEEGIIKDEKYYQIKEVSFEELK